MPVRLPLGLAPGGRYHDWLRAKAGYVVADVDGTLVGSGRVATGPVAEAVRQAAAAGIRFSLATGRLAAGVRELQVQLGLTGPALLQNGAQVVEDGDVLHSWPLPRAAVTLLREWYRGHDWYLELHTADEFYASDSRELARRTWELVSGAPAGLISAPTWDAELLRGVVVLPSADGLVGVMAELESLGLLAQPATSPLFPGMHFVNITSSDADKGSALVWTARHLDIPLASVVAIGDGANDLSMFAVAGTAIAMGQSDVTVQQAAHLVVSEVGTDGVAHALAAAVAGWPAPDRSQTD